METIVLPDIRSWSALCSNNCVSVWSGLRLNCSTQGVLIQTIDDQRKSLDDDSTVGAFFLDLISPRATSIVRVWCAGNAEEWFWICRSGRH